MRILQVGSGCGGWGGIERYIAYLTNGLIDRGHEIHVACPAGSQLDVRCAGIHHDIAQPYLYRPTAVLPINRLVRDVQFDLIHFHYRKDFILPTWAAMMGTKAPRIMTRHVPSTWNWWKSSNYRRTFHHFISVSEAIRKDLIENCKIPASKITTAHAGCPPNTTEYERADSNKFRVGYFGRLVNVKGVHVLIEAAKQLPEGIEVLIYGSGPQEEELRALADGTCCNFMGQVADVFEAMANVDVVAIPSLWLEAFPFSALEAMAVGKSIIATDSGGLPEQVRHNETGLLVPKNDAVALSRAICSLASDRSNCADMGNRGREIQRTEFTVEKFAERVEAVYESVLAQRNS